MQRPALPALVVTKSTADISASWVSLAQRHESIARGSSHGFASLTAAHGEALRIRQVTSPTSEGRLHAQEDLLDIFLTPPSATTPISADHFVTAPSSPTSSDDSQDALGYMLRPPASVAAEPMDPTVAEATKVLGRRRSALLIGINYEGKEYRGRTLQSCHHDVDAMKGFLCSQWSWQEDEFVIMKDDQSDPKLHPSRENIIHQINALVAAAKPGDHLFFQFSGHGFQLKDLDGDEEDGQDEVIIPTDLLPIIDDELHEIMVRPIPAGCRLTAIFDCCSSGTALDLPHSSPPCSPRVNWPSIITQRPASPLPTSPSSARAHTVLDLPHSYDVRPPSPLLETPKGRKKYCDGDVILWSACLDGQEAREVIAKDSKKRGAMTHAFIEALMEKPQQSYQELLDTLTWTLNVWTSELDLQHAQLPQLSSSRVLNMDDIFSLV